MSTLKSSSSSISVLASLILPVKNNQKYEFSMDFLTLINSTHCCKGFSQASTKNNITKSILLFYPLLRYKIKVSIFVFKYYAFSMSRNISSLISTAVESSSSKIPARTEEKHMIERDLFCNGI